MPPKIFWIIKERASLPLHFPSLFLLSLSITFTLFHVFFFSQTSVNMQQKRLQNNSVLSLKDVLAQTSVRQRQHMRVFVRVKKARGWSG